MSWKLPAVKKGDGEKSEKAPPGNHPAVLVAIINLGHQWEEPFSQPKPGEKKQVAKYVHKMYYVYELVTKRLTGKHNENHLIAVELTYSMYESAKMRLWVEARIGRKIGDSEVYDVADEIGKPVLLNVMLKGEYPRVVGVSGIPDGLAVPPPLRKPLGWKLGDPYETIPSWVPWYYGRPIAEKIAESEEVTSGAVPPPNPQQGNPVGQSQPQPPVQQPQQQPTTVVPPAGNAFRRPQPKPTIPPEPTDASEWMVWVDDDGGWCPMTAADINEQCEITKTQKHQIKVYPRTGTEADARTADLWGFKATTPF